MPTPRRITPSSRSTATRAVRVFLATEVAGGIVLLIATAVALVWANSPWDTSYQQLWATELGFELGRWHLGLHLREWVNEALMAIFFLVVGLEVKRELVQGELRDPRRAALPVIAAAGGMIVPALLYLAINIGGDGARGWGIPMATDIAFALGVLALVAPGVSPTLRVFLLTLAIVDDIGAIIVIATFYSGDIEFPWLAVALATVAAVYALRQLGLSFTPAFIVLGAFLWLALHSAGIHATLAGVAMGLLAPATSVLDREIVLSRSGELLDVFSPEAARTTTRMARQSVSQLEWLEHVLHPWSSLAIVPVFAFANAGVLLTGDAVTDAATSPVALGVVAGLVAGKIIGITGATWVAVRSRVADLPEGADLHQIIGIAALGGIGFTVSLFITGLAFDEPTLVEEAKIGILVASLIASAVGAVLLRRRSKPELDADVSRPDRRGPQPSSLR